MSITAEIIKSFRFEAAHFLPNVGPDHQCRNIHGHSYKVTLRIIGPLHEKMGWVMDLSELNHAFAPLLAQLDHRLLNDIKGLENPTGENVAYWILKNLEPSLPLLSSVTVKATGRIAVTIYKNKNYYNHKN